MSRKTWQVAASCAAICAAFVATQAAAAINVQVLSSMPQLVTGGDALVKITGATAAPTVTVGGADVSSMFKGDAKNGWTGYSPASRTATTLWSPRSGSDTATVTLVNHGDQRHAVCRPAAAAVPLRERSASSSARRKDANCSRRYRRAATSTCRRPTTSGRTSTPKGARPADIADTAVGPNRVPVIVRIETRRHQPRRLRHHDAARSGGRPARRRDNPGRRQGLERQADLRLRRRRAGDLPPGADDRPQRHQHRRQHHGRPSAPARLRAGLGHAQRLRQQQQRRDVGRDRLQGEGALHRGIRPAESSPSATARPAARCSRI